MAMMGIMMSEMNYPRENKSRTFIPKEKKDDIQPKNTFQYWFRKDGSFLSEKRDIPMRKDECIFKCYAMNDKNAIKKFNKSNKK